MYKFFLFLISLILFQACSGGGGSSDGAGGTLTENKTGYLIDSAVEGVEYYINGIYKGDTSYNGGFQYKQNDAITFKVGGVEIGTISSVSTDNYVLLQDICEVERVDASSLKVLNLATFLQSLDNDDNPYNGIKISSSMKNYFKKSLKLKDMDYSEISAIISKTGKSVHSKDTVVAHLKDTLTSNGITPLELDENKLPEFYNTKVGLPALPAN